MQYYIAQGIGLVAFVIAVLSFQHKSRNGILLWQLASCTLFSVHFILLHTYVGALLNVIAALRAFVFSQKAHAWARSRFWLGFFVVVCTAAALASWEDWFSILPVIGMIITTISFWIEDARLVRRFSFPSSPCWWLYNFHSGSWAGVMTETFVMCSILVAMWRYEWSPAARRAAQQQKKAAHGK